MADSLYAQYHNTLLSANPPQSTQTSQHQSRKAVFARLAQPFLGASRPPSSSGPKETPANGGLGGGAASITSAP